MSNYSEEIIKQAEELIEKHYPLVSREGFTYKTSKKLWTPEQLKRDNIHIRVVKAAIESCEFARKFQHAEYAVTISDIQNHLKTLL